MISFMDLAYFAGLSLLSPVWAWRLLRYPQKYRQGWRAKLWGDVPARESALPCLWFHAVSVGEVNLLRPLLVEVERRLPGVDIRLSTTTRSGFEVASKKYAALHPFYTPFDWSWAVRRAVARIRPSVLVLTELEIWPQLIAEAKNAGVRVAVVNGRLSDRSFRGYRMAMPFLRPTFQRLDAVAAQDQRTAERFIALGVPSDRVFVTGSLKFDGAECDRGNPHTQSLRELAGIARDETVFLAGSTQEGEEAAALEVFRRLAPTFPRLRLILVPRHPERFESVAELLRASGLPWLRRSELAPDRPLPVHWPDGQRTRVPPAFGSQRHVDVPSGTPQQRTFLPVILVDTVGELSAWWGLADIAFVGGSFGNRGGQNMLEPAGYGAAVSFGPNTWNFRDIVKSLLQAEAAVVVHDARELEVFVRRCLEQPAYARSLGQRAQNLVLSHRGATLKTFEILRRLLSAREKEAGLKLRRSA
ncbi:MAG: 3-deoxy-D-manno-octulosonic acid transferase [Thermogutta sp.]|uniref:3-deoxy-D-manno-octulosonic acid transferase n=1 Tax=Thermogutta sp. TaxID=1962930 RepID=UPI0019C20725|nr:3-deoxy-D-manno-octulosonic acid transferase [Thermogutta sp.]MBC7351489.1 3-deoxy-D-manno-octulosonic acid transferase [Thermogutta sp.]